MIFFSNIKWISLTLKTESWGSVGSNGYWERRYYAVSQKEMNEQTSQPKKNVFYSIMTTFDPSKFTHQNRQQGIRRACGINMLTEVFFPCKIPDI